MKLLPLNLLEVIFTQKCNLSCTYCFERFKNNKNADPEEFVNNWISNKILNIPSSQSLYLLGGEHFLNTDFSERVVNDIETFNISDSQKDKLLNSIIKGISTNGTLLEEHLDTLKKNNSCLQISLDGPEVVNDSFRKSKEGKGYYSKVLNNLKLLRENNIEYYLHSTLCPENFKYLKDIFKWFIEQQLLLTPNNPTPNGFCQINLESEITDDQIDNFLHGLIDTVEMCLYDNFLDRFDETTRKKLAFDLIMHRWNYKKCFAGATGIAYDNEFVGYACHREATFYESREDGILIPKEGKINYNLTLEYIEAYKRGQAYGPLVNYDSNTFISWTNYCPATAKEISGSTFQSCSKLNVLIKEINLLIPKLIEEYRLKESF